MTNLRALVITFIPLWLSFGHAGERSVLSLQNFCETELKSAGIEISQPTTFHVKALGGGGDYGWTYKTNEMFAYGWILNADTRKMVWMMDIDNTTRSKGDREFDEKMTLNPGSYEVYFAVPTYAYHTTFTHININIDRREKPLFGERKKKKDQDFFGFFKNWWSDDIEKEWDERCERWGIEVLVDESAFRTVRTFTVPKELPNVVLKATGVGEDELVRQGFTVTEPTTVQVYALGEAAGENEMYDYAWIVNATSRAHVWDTDFRGSSHAGGADKNIECTGDVVLPRGDYVLYCVSDDSHSSLDWNSSPPYDPMNWGVTLSVKTEQDKKKIKLYQYQEDQNVILALTKMKDNEHRTEGFTLKEDTKVRIYGFGERGNSRRSMADYGVVVDAKTRNKVWVMDVDRSRYAGGASKNRYVDEVITVPKGSYIVTYSTDDSHAFGDWNDKPPFDPEHYGITLMGVGDKFNASVVGKYAEQRDKSIVAQITRVGDNADEEKRFKMDKTTRVRIYAIGEGEKREMYDYGWIEDVRTGSIVWEMKSSMTFHAGGGRKNRVVNTTIVLDKGEYTLHYRSDDSHSYNDWNVDPPEDQEFWGITVFRDDTAPPDVPSAPPSPPKPE
ncbi:MAG TPA: hypothetical protein DGH68_10275 [Bacteroidetes bacterium]|jgi:hypothetical protein|nr:hypothetical protein [Bacteroidota bacterium]